MGRRQNYRIPDGYFVRGWRFEVETTTPQQRLLIHQHFGARRFAYNWALAEVTDNLHRRAVDPSVPALAWTLPTLRKTWNQRKAEVAPWWPSCSKEAYASGIADLVTALQLWSGSKRGQRERRQVGFPRFKARHRDHGRVRFHNGAMRLEPDRRHLTLPVIGKLRSKENTRSLQRLLTKDRARLLSMTLSEYGGRLFVSVATTVVQVPRSPREPGLAAGLILALAPSGRSSPMVTVPSSGSPIPHHGRTCISSAAASLDSFPVESSAPEDTARREPSWRHSTGGRRACAARRSIPSPPDWPAATARSWWRT
jgi:hypothetical protein